MTDVRAVVIGGGVAGASIAYHLTELGWSDVLLVDRSDLTSGSTFHSAGLVGQLRSSVTLTRMMMYGVELYRRLAAETGVDPSWHEVGSLRLASSRERIEELQRLAGWGRTFGLPLEIVSTAEALELWPLFDPAGVLGAAYLPTDGYLDPNGLAFALAEGAKRRGATIRTGARVVGIDVDRGRARGVRFEDGDAVRADVVVNAGGMYADQIGRLAGVPVPVVPFAHQYLLTKPLEGVRADMPTMRDPDRLVYFRPEAGGGLVAGGYERDPAPVVLAGRAAGGLQPHAPRGGLGAVRAARRRRLLGRPGDADRRDRDDDQRPGGLHARRGVHPRGVRGRRVLRRGRVLRARHRRRGRRRQGDGAVDRRGRARAGRLEDGHPPVRPPLREPPLRDDPRVRGLRHLLRHPLPERGALGGTAAEDGADVRAPRRPRRGLRREGRVGAPQLVRLQRGRALRGPAAPGLGRAALVDRDRRRAPRDARARGAVRRVELREDRGGGARRLRVPPADLRERRRPSRRDRRLHADAQPAGRHRVRPHGHAAGRRALPHRDGDRVRSPRRRLDPQAPRPRGPRDRPRRDGARSPASASGDRAPARSSRRSRARTCPTTRSRT